MVHKRRASKTAGLVFAIATCICVACGGKSTVGLPTAGPLDPSVAAANAAWGEWKQGPGQFLDQDFYDCYELNNVPRPTVPTPEDPSGHTRGRRGCDGAIQAVTAALPDYQRFADIVAAVTPPKDATGKAEYDAVVNARTTRLQWVKNLVTAAQNHDTAAENSLRLQIPSLANLEALALGLDLSHVTPPPRPTLPYIPGVPTGTPTPKR